LRLFVGDAGPLTDDLSLGEDRFLLWPLSSPVGLLASALVVSVAMLPPSFSHRSSIFFFRRFLAIGSGIVVSSVSLVLYLSFASHQRRDERSFETIFEFTGFGLLAHEIIRYRKANIFCFNIDMAFVIPRQALC
jgi:hypothetical protein